MDPIKVQFIKSDASSTQGTTKGKTKSRIKLLDIKDPLLSKKWQIACTGVIHSANAPKEGLFGRLLRALGLRRWVLLKVTDGDETCIAKVNTRSLRDRMEISGADYKLHLKEHGNDFTDLVSQRISNQIVILPEVIPKQTQSTPDPVPKEIPSAANTDQAPDLASQRSISLVDQDPAVGTPVIVERLTPKAVFNEGTFVSSSRLADGSKRIRVHLYGKNYMELDAKNVYLKS